MFDQDIAEAKALMAAGYAEGVKVTVNLITVPVFVRHGEVLAEQLRKSLGIECVLEPVDVPTAVDRASGARRTCRSRPPASFCSTRPIT